MLVVCAWLDWIISEVSSDLNDSVKENNASSRRDFFLFPERSVFWGQQSENEFQKTIYILKNYFVSFVHSSTLLKVMNLDVMKFR